MDVKRRRSDAHNTSRENGIDVYDEATDSSSSARAELFTEVRSSWMRVTNWASRNDGQRGECHPNISQELVALQQQLSQVKRRLRPAAERSTESSNSHHNSPSRGTTTGRREFAEARRACNPYEVLGEGRNGGLNTLFMNRSAVKLANIDAMLDFVVSTPLTTDGSFSFVDICAAPGGFSEYLGQRCLSNGLTIIRGFGMSLLSCNEYGEATPWKMQDSSATDNDVFSQYRVCEGEDGTGDILNWANVLALQSMVELDTHTIYPPDVPVPYANKVDLVVADGGFDAQRDSDQQEQVAQKLVVCECAAGLLLLKPKGNFVIKMFGFQTEVIRTMMKDMFLMFDDLIVIKPISSRPASAERYVVCRGFHGLLDEWDGQAWTSSILLGKLTSALTGTKAEQERMFAFDVYLDRFDRDMASLNLKACFSILSFLENKCLAINCPTYDGSEHSHEFDDDAPLVDTEAYKVAWRLM